MEKKRKNIVIKVIYSYKNFHKESMTVRLKKFSDGKTLFL